MGCLEMIQLHYEKRKYAMAALTVTQLLVSYGHESFKKV